MSNPYHCEHAEMAQECDRNTFKLILLGDSGVGKSTILRRYADGNADSPGAETMHVRTIYVDGKRVQLRIWDTAGQERFGGFLSSFYRGAYGAIVVYDITNDDTYNSLTRWLHEIDEHSNVPKFSRVLVGNKSDLAEEQRVVARKDAAKFAKEIGVQLFETSALQNVNIEAVFIAITRLMLQREEKNNSVQARGENISIRVQNSLRNGSKCSC